jgi:RNA polymerase sigma-70 factor (ECF subfamily)
MDTDSPASSLRTRSSLLFRLRDWQDKESWDEFYGLYRRLVYGFSRKSGLSHEEAEEVTNDVFVRVAATVQDFESDPRVGSFRGWLMTLTRWRITDKYRSRPKDQRKVQSNRPSDATSTIERIPDSREDTAIWEREWQSRILEAAMDRVAKKSRAKHFQIFDLHMRQHWSIFEISKELDISSASIYLVNHRLTKLLKREVETLKKTLG